MNTVKVIIERNADRFTAYVENVEGIYGCGDTVEKTIQSILYWINVAKNLSIKELIPETLKGDYKIVYRLDVESLLNHYKPLFTNSGLQLMTGINQRQLSHYSSGRKRPRAAQRKIIMNALHELAFELLSIEL